MSCLAGWYRPVQSVMELGQGNGGESLNKLRMALVGLWVQAQLMKVSACSWYLCGGLPVGSSHRLSSDPQAVLASSDRLPIGSRTGVSRQKNERLFGVPSECSNCVGVIPVPGPSWRGRLSMFVTHRAEMNSKQGASQKCNTFQTGSIRNKQSSENPGRVSSS